MFIIYLCLCYTAYIYRDLVFIIYKYINYEDYIYHLYSFFNILKLTL